MMSCMFTSEFLIIRELLIYIKEAFPDALVILGGEHATAMSAAILKYEENIDYIIAALSDKVKETNYYKIGGGAGNALYVENYGIKPKIEKIF